MLSPGKCTLKICGKKLIRLLSEFNNSCYQKVVRLRVKKLANPAGAGSVPEVVGLFPKAAENTETGHCC